MRPTLALLAAALCLSPAHAVEPHGGPVIDMHLHAYSMDEIPPGAPSCPGDQQVRVPTIDPREEIDFSAFVTCQKPIFAAADDAGLRDGTLAALRKHNVRRAMTGGPVERVADWRRAAPDVIVPGVSFGTRKDTSIEELRRLHAAGHHPFFYGGGMDRDGEKGEDGQGNEETVRQQFSHGSPTPPGRARL